MGMEHAIKTAQQKALRWSVSAGWVTAVQSLIFTAGSSRRVNWHFDVPVRSNVVPFGGAEIYYGTNPLAFAAREKATRSLPLIWRLPYRHGESARRPLA